MTAQREEPFVGPRPFEPNDRRIFFGRDDEVKDLTALAVFHRVLLLHAQSGAGKTSLINTKLVPTLIEDGFDVLPPARVSGSVPAGVDVANVFVFNLAMSLGGHPQALPELARLPLARVLQRRLENDPALFRAPEDLPVAGAARAPMLIIDQFEELFTTHADRWREREAFFEAVAESLRAIPNLRVMFSMREDRIAELDPYAWLLPQGIDSRYRLELLREDAARDAIALPVTLFGRTFEATAVDKLVRELLATKIDHPEGGSVTVQGEFVESVQLQIVCQRLWRQLDPSVTVITTDHLLQFGDVATAIIQFYEETVRDAAVSHDYPEELIHLECSRYVTPSGKRGVIEQQRQSTGRLRNDIVQTLEDEHLLRSEPRGGSRWYELAHDRLVDPILKRRESNKDFQALITATELLERTQGSGEPERRPGESLVLGALTPEFASRLRLSKQEIAFLAAEVVWGGGAEVEKWTAALVKEDAATVADTLDREATHRDRPAVVRQMIARALGFVPGSGAVRHLVRLALDDPDEGVREAAALSLARLDDPVLTGQVMDALETAARRRTARAALAHMRNESVIATLGHGALLEKPAVRLERAWSQIPWRNRVTLTGDLARLRIRRSGASILYMALSAGFFAAFTTAATRWFPAWWGRTLGQSPDEPQWFAGIFQGLWGGFVWASFIVGTIAIGEAVFKRFRNTWWHNPTLMRCLMGVAGGFVGGLGILASIFGVYTLEALVATSWLPTLDRSLAVCSLQTRYCLVHPLYGVFLGLGIAAGVCVLRRTPRWESFFRGHLTEDPHWPKMQRMDSLARPDRCRALAQPSVLLDHVARARRRRRVCARSHGRSAAGSHRLHGGIADDLRGRRGRARRVHLRGAPDEGRDSHPAGARLNARRLESRGGLCAHPRARGQPPARRRTQARAGDRGRRHARRRVRGGPHRPRRARADRGVR